MPPWCGDPAAPVVAGGVRMQKGRLAAPFPSFVPCPADQRKTISTRRFCGSRTFGPVGTSGRLKP